VRTAHSVEFVAKRLAEELSREVHELEQLPSLRRRRVIFNELSDAALTALITLAVPWNPSDHRDTQRHLRELRHARRVLATFRTRLNRAVALGWLDQPRAEPLDRTAEELSALLLVLHSNVRSGYRPRTSR